MHFIYELAVPMTQQLETTFRYGAGVPQAQAQAPHLGGSTSVTPAVAEAEAEHKETSNPSIEEDRLKDAREKVREEITREFATLMTSGSWRASEAAALAARRVMERHGRLNATSVTPAVAEQEDPKKSIEEESAVQGDAEIKSIEEESTVHEDAEKSIEEEVVVQEDAEKSIE